MDIPFTFFVSLLREISRSRTTRPNPLHVDYPALAIFRRWSDELHAQYTPLPEGMPAMIIRLLFPEEDVRRKYDMQETRLAGYLADCFGIRKDILINWRGEDREGCLGVEVRKAIEERTTSGDDIGRLTINQVDGLLDELAATCPFSHPSLRNTNARPRHHVLRALYADLPPLDAQFLTQIILKDLRPVLYPLSAMHYTTALKEYHSKSVQMLRKKDIMWFWRSIGDECRRPKVGQFIEIPKSVKGQGRSSALQTFSKSDVIWVETKYDGERAQIHFEVLDDGSERIRIYSKSRRDSTLDRWGVHGIIKDALSLQKANTDGVRVVKNVVLDAEMVAYSDTLGGIDEFWRIRSLVQATALGVRGARRISEKMSQPDSQIDACSQLSSDTSDQGTRHLALVFFDVLMLNSSSLLSTPYSTRRSILETLIRPLQGRAMLAERSPILLNGIDGMEKAKRQLRKVFAGVIGDYQEGVVIKSQESVYGDWRCPWVKLKKDYIPGYGDTLDLVALGASWDKDRGRELRVPPTAYTTFYVGALENASLMKTNPSLLPHFYVYFTVSYGLTREQLEELNFLIKTSGPLKYNTANRPSAYTFQVFSGLQPPAVIFDVPLLMELLGAGFTKAPKSNYYELRFPRIRKVFRIGERGWKEGVNLQDLQEIAREAVGQDRPGKDVDDWCKSLWGKPMSPGVKSREKTKVREEGWEAKLEIMDEKTKKRKRASDLTVLDGQKSGRRVVRKRIALSSRPQTSNAKVEHDIELGKRDKRGEQTSSPITAVTSNFSRRCGKEDKPAILTQSAASSTRIWMAPRDYRTCHGRQSRADDFTSDMHNGVAEFPAPRPSSPKLRKEGQGDLIPSCSSPISKFFSTSLIWFSRPGGSPRSRWRSPFGQVLKRDCRIHSLDSLLIACGWNDGDGPCVEFDRGVIFVDCSEGDNRKCKVLEILGERRAALRCGRRRKPIWVFDEKLLGYEAIRRDSFDVEAQALFMLG